MSQVPTQLESEWVQALDEAEKQITSLLRQMPKDKLVHYVNDLNTWSTRVGDEAIARAFRTLYAMGYSKSAVATTLGIGGPSLNRIIRDEGVEKRNSRSTVVPQDVIDIREEFAALSD